MFRYTHLKTTKNLDFVPGQIHLTLSNAKDKKAYQKGVDVLVQVKDYYISAARPGGAKGLLLGTKKGGGAREGIKALLLPFPLATDAAVLNSAYSPASGDVLPWSHSFPFSLPRMCRR
jgi:hypothetical protein